MNVHGFDSWDAPSLVAHLPSIHDLFASFDGEFFEAMLSGCLLEWSDRMTLCAGTCALQKSRLSAFPPTEEKTAGGSSSCTIRLSRPLLSLRPFRDTVDTLLHEMIHAYLFIKFGGDLNRDGHGPLFLHKMEEINRKASTSITVYHGFRDEVDFHRKHVWRCGGVCKNRPPFYGWVRRAANRAPQPADRWWLEHQSSCGGVFHKISGPEDTARRSRQKTGMPNGTTAPARSGRKPGESSKNSDAITLDEALSKLQQTRPACQGAGGCFRGEEPPSPAIKDPIAPRTYIIIDD